MEKINFKTHYSAKELAELSLHCLPKTKQGILYQAKTQGWITRKKVGVGGQSLEFALDDLPIQVQSEIHTRFAVAVVNKPRSEIASVRANLDVQGLCDKQREIADARMALVAYVAELEKVKTRFSAVQQVIEMAKCGTLPTHLAELVSVANAKQGANRTLSQRSLMQWVVDYHKCTSMVERLQRLAPIGLGRKKQDIWALPWLHDFLREWADPNCPDVVQCVKRCRELSIHPLPSMTTIRRVLNSLPVIVRERGRTTGSKYRQFLPYTVRDWDVLYVNECWVGDGHGFKAKVRHPLSARPFKPEITVILDGKTRYVVGWSVHMSENHLAVADAMRHGISRCGLPTIYYSDNGGGEKNKRLDADLTGILPRLGIHHETGIPGNPQGRGIIERFWQTVTIPLAKSYASFDGKDMDEDTKRRRYKALSAAENALNKGKELSPVHQKAMQSLPHFADFLTDLERAIDGYNHAPHSSLPKSDGVHLSPAKYRDMLMAERQSEIEFLNDFELSLLFRPEEIRKVSRSIVELFNNTYFSTELADWHGKNVRVCYDLHDANSVIVKSMEGAWICVAQWNGNKNAAFAQSVREKAREKALAAAIKRKQEQIDSKVALYNPVITIEQQVSHGLNLKTVELAEKVPAKRRIFTSQVEKDEYEQEQRLQAIGGRK